MSRYVRIVLLAGVTALAGTPALLSAQVHTPVIGQSLRYCNPLPIMASSADGSPRGVSLGDVTIVREAGAYYMFNTGGGAWVSTDLVDWKYHAVTGARVPVAPHVVKYNGLFYMSGNESPLYRAPGILGPYELVGPWTDEKGQPWSGVAVNGRTWNGAFDVFIFVDDDNQPYLYYPGRSTDGIFVVPLDPDRLNHFAAPPRHLFGFDPSHTWERWGEANEYSNISWIEGPWVIKHNGTYYLEYSASGTQWTSYATGYYTSRSPLGPFTYAPNNPLMRKTGGVVTGAGHGSIIEGPDGKWWQFYTIVLPNYPGGRRLGMDPVGFDAAGNMFIRVTETPQWAPGVVADPARHGDSGSLPLTIGKARAMNQRSTFSSERPGHEAAYAVDNTLLTWWEPAESDTLPTMTVDLGSLTEFDLPQLFTVDAVRLIFATGGRGAFAAPGTNPPVTPGRNVAHRYRVDVSEDGQAFSTILDRTGNDVTRYTEFAELPPTRARFVRLAITDWPRVVPLGVMEFTVFGQPVAAGGR